MVKHKRHFYDPLPVTIGLLTLSILIWLVVMREFRLDDSFITYRYALNLASGLGLVYNQGDSTLSTTAPLYAMLLAGLSFIVPDFHILGSLIGVASIGLGSIFVYRLLARQLPASLAVWAGAVYTLSSLLWLSHGMETALWIMLVLAAFWFIQEDNWVIVGLLMGLAVLIRPDAAIPAGLAGLSAIWATFSRLGTRREWWKPVIVYGLAAAVPVLIFSLWAWVTYGSPFPVTLSAKSAQAVLGITGLGYDVTYWEGLRLILRSLMTQSPLYISFALLILFGLAGKFSTSIRLVVAWGTLHLIAYLVMGVAPYRWYYAPFVPGAVMLGANGLQYIDRRLLERRVPIGRFVVIAIAVFPILAQITSFSRISDMIQKGGAVDVMLPIVDWQAYREAGEWLDENTPSDATVGVAEVGQVGFYANRWMTDYLGLLQPDVAAGLKRGDLYSWLINYAPNYLIFQRFRGAALVLYNYVIQDDPWFNANYQPVAEFDDSRYASGPVTIFERTTPDLPLTEQHIQLDYDNLRLVGLATDANETTTDGGAVRVRLDWEVVGALPSDLHIAVKIIDDARNPGYDGDYDTAYWVDRFSTWHGFVVPKMVKPGQYALLVAVGPQGGPYHEQLAGEIQIRAP